MVEGGIDGPFSWSCSIQGYLERVDIQTGDAGISIDAEKYKLQSKLWRCWLKDVQRSWQVLLNASSSIVAVAHQGGII